jgi:hypothetical protein
MWMLSAHQPMANRIMDSSPTLGTRPNRQALRMRPRGLRGNISTLIFQPVTFFRDLATAEPNRQAFWVAVLVLGLIGFSAVQRAALQPVSDPFAVGVPPAGATQTWTTALLAASVIVVSWLVQSVLLCEVSLLNGKAPRFGLNMKVVVWASIPLGLMALINLIFYSVGGQPPPPGASTLLTVPPFDAMYAGLSSFPQTLVMTLTSRITLPWLWNLVLIYLGARHALNGKRLAALLVLIAWVVLLIMIPALANSGSAAPVDPMVQPMF